MLLVADVGNTSTVFVVYDGDTVVDTIRTKTGDHKVKELTEKYYPVNMAFISSVVPSVNERLKKYLEYLYECEVKFLDSKCDTGLRICTDAPEKTGADIICGAAAAFDRYKKPVVVFDLGTATTVCAVDREGNYLGHAIYPGVRTSFDALHRAAEQLPEIDDRYDDFELIGKNTVSSIKSGVIIGAACFIDGMAERYRKAIGEDAAVVVTGGLAPVILPYCTGKYDYDEFLLPEGLKLICNRTYNRTK